MQFPRIVRLIEAITNAWTKCLMPPYGTGEYSAVVDDRTDCNRFVHDVLDQLGYSKFWDEREKRPILANVMVLYMERHPEEWLQVSGDVAQSHANEGAVVVAGWRNPLASGHVCIVRPGIPEASGSWGIMEPKVPKVANVGRPEQCRMDRKASFAFGKEHQPKYYLLKESLP